MTKNVLQHTRTHGEHYSSNSETNLQDTSLKQNQQNSLNSVDRSNTKVFNLTDRLNNKSMLRHQFLAAQNIF